MLNAGIGFIGFGLILWLYSIVPTIGSTKRVTVPATIVGYRQFPNDSIITEDNIYRGANFSWTRVVEFKHPQSGQTLQMNTNPKVANPETIGTRLEVNADPSNTDPLKDFVWVNGGMRAARKMATISFTVGLVVSALLMIVPNSSIFYFLIIFIGFFCIFIPMYIQVWRRPNQ